MSSDYNTADAPCTPGRYNSINTPPALYTPSNLPALHSSTVNWIHLHFNASDKLKNNNNPSLLTNQPIHIRATASSFGLTHHSRCACQETDKQRLGSLLCSSYFAQLKSRLPQTAIRLTVSHARSTRGLTLENLFLPHRSRIVFSVSATSPLPSLFRLSLILIIIQYNFVRNNHETMKLSTRQQLNYL